MRAKSLTLQIQNQDLLQTQGLLTGQCFENSIFWWHYFYWEKHSDTVQEKKNLRQLLNHP